MPAKRQVHPNEIALRKGDTEALKRNGVQGKHANGGFDLLFDQAIGRGRSDLAEWLLRNSTMEKPAINIVGTASSLARNGRKDMIEYCLALGLLEPTDKDVRIALDGNEGVKLVTRLAPRWDGHWEGAGKKSATDGLPSRQMAQAAMITASNGNKEATAEILKIIPELAQAAAEGAVRGGQLDLLRIITKDHRVAGAKLLRAAVSNSGGDGPDRAAILNYILVRRFEQRDLDEALETACSGGKTQHAVILMERGANLKGGPTQMPEAPLRAAIEKSREETIEMLLGRYSLQDLGTSSMAPDPMIWEEVERRGLGLAEIERLDPTLDLLAKVAKNPNLSRDEILNLLTHKNEKVRAGAAGNLNCHPAWIDKIASGGRKSIFPTEAQKAASGNCASPRQFESMALLGPVPPKKVIEAWEAWGERNPSEKNEDDLKRMRLGTLRAIGRAGDILTTAIDSGKTEVVEEILGALKNAGDELEPFQIRNNLAEGLSIALIRNEATMAQAILDTIDRVSQDSTELEDSFELMVTCLQRCLENHTIVSDTGPDALYAIQPEGTKLLKETAQNLLEKASEMELSTAYERCEGTVRKSASASARFESIRDTQPTTKAGKMVMQEMSRRRKMDAVKSTRRPTIMARVEI
jgi:hypothetical protein